MSGWYVIVSPEFTYTEVVIPETGQGPTEVTRDVALVKAPNAQAAKWGAARLWIKHATPSWECWPEIARRDGRHPLTGVTAQRWEDVAAEDPDLPSEPELSSWLPFVREVPA